MFECRACLLRTLRAVAGDAVTSASFKRAPRSILAPSTATPFRRAASTAAAVKHADEDSPASTGDSFDDGFRQSPRAIAKADDKALRTELRFLQDPLKLAEHVHYTLRCNKPDKALDLCRMASREREVTVSWNHCIDWHMSNNKIDAAIKIYNEMKKRAQFPDSHTYILLLRGLAKPHHHGELVKQANVVKALSIYNSMSGPTSRVKPTVWHTNATLRVCAAALDMDALWGIAAKLPTKGPNMPDHVTYAILLNAIRHGAMGSVGSDNAVIDARPEQIATRRQEAVNQGRRIWQEIIAKWRAGEVHIDEQLVCAIGRLLLISKRIEDWDDVLNLIHQTMNIERQIPLLGSDGRHTEHIPLAAPEVSDEPTTPLQDAEGYTAAPSGKAFNAITPLPASRDHPKRPETLSYVAPGNATLSLLIEACALLRTPKAANAYWDLLTSSASPYEPIKADHVNFTSMLKFLSLNRSSARAVRILHTMEEQGVVPKYNIFRIAMSICHRDKNNPNVLGHAGEVVDFMNRQPAFPDVHTLIQYLNLALLSEDGTKIDAALDRLKDVMKQLGERLSSPPDPRGHDLGDRQQIVAFFQCVIGVMDTLVRRRLVPDSEHEMWNSRRAELNRLISGARGRLDWDREEPSKSARPARRFESGPPVQMSAAQWAMKKAKWAERKTREKNESRQRVDGLSRWDVRSGRRAEENRRMFADSAGDMAVR